jgi:hypothetical protein
MKEIMLEDSMNVWAYKKSINLAIINVNLLFLKRLCPIKFYGKIIIFEETISLNKDCLFMWSLSHYL